MTFVIGDNVIIRNTSSELDGRRGYITNITIGSPPPYQVSIDGALSWFVGECLVLDCRCENVGAFGCVCGVAKREKESLTERTE